MASESEAMARLAANIEGCQDCGRVVGEKHHATCPVNLRLQEEARKRSGGTEAPPVVLGNRGYETDAAGQSIEDQASKIARNCMADAVAMQACKWAADMSEDERGKLMAALLTAERGDPGEPWVYEYDTLGGIPCNRRVVLQAGWYGTVTIGLDEPVFEVRDGNGDVDGLLVW